MSPAVIDLGPVAKNQQCCAANVDELRPHNLLVALTAISRLLTEAPQLAGRWRARSEVHNGFKGIARPGR
ncbi:hypothetical protein GLAREA_04357 [Glarea lozoyensis ATCC 20868]|uniref:Uncharacterized protein n=1 Tax=Glarea lozoyensis (strain ATCC 20868 / MF5171) TaxID=1116229 RepID=S3D674_GLAL2|nr:uncharacterized protein GLAREA_04357 [Glarea lozoyensis ATCC 20868]EPE27566.1 hypothetical protein GLAREA_04357 [Glarea lozoyensis ATCC 20868]